MKYNKQEQVKILSKSANFLDLNWGIALVFLAGKKEFVGGKINNEERKKFVSCFLGL